jgi:hypothetical protein
VEDRPSIVKRPGPDGLLAATGVNLATPEESTSLADGGITVSPLPTTVADELELHQRFAAELERSDPRPAHRIAHFRWLEDTKSFRLQGWTGRVASSGRLDGDLWLVTVNVFPSLSHKWFGKTMVSRDYIIEKYFYDGQTLEYVEGIDPPDAIRALLMP